MAKSKKEEAQPRISDAEWTVMRVFWEEGVRTVAEAVKVLDGRLHWKPRTVQTLVRRLAEKGALAVETVGREYRYSPAVSQADCQHEESRSFLRKVFDGRLAPFVASLMEREQLRGEDLEALRKMLREAEKKNRK